MLTLGSSQTHHKQKTSFGASKRKIINALHNKPAGTIERIIGNEVRLHQYDEAYRTAECALRAPSEYKAKRNPKALDEGFESYVALKFKTKELENKTNGIFTELGNKLSLDISARLAKIFKKQEANIQSQYKNTTPYYRIMDMFKFK